MGEIERYRHLKRGTVYEIIGTAELQAMLLQREGAHLVIYRGEDGKLWARNSGEFHDGRFERVASSDMAGAGEKCALPPKGWSCTRTPGHDGPCAAVPNDNSLEDEIAEALTDSLDMDWTSSVGARHVMALLREKGIVS